MAFCCLSDLSLEDSGNYSCEVRAPKSALLGHVTHRIFVRCKSPIFIAWKVYACATLINDRYASEANYSLSFSNLVYNYFSCYRLDRATNLCHLFKSIAWSRPSPHSLTSNLNPLTFFTFHSKCSDIMAFSKCSNTIFIELLVKLA